MTANPLREHTHTGAAYDIFQGWEINIRMVYFSTYANPQYSTSYLRQIRNYYTSAWHVVLRLLYMDLWPQRLAP